MEITLNTALDLIRSRRSTRNYTGKPIPASTLSDIIEAGRYAPSGSNNQSSHFIVVSGEALMTELRGIISALLANTPVREGMPKPLIGLIETAKKNGSVEVMYNAPVLVAVANKKEYPNAAADSACALENMMLAAAAAKVGSCWINIFSMMREAPPMRAFFSKIGLKDEEDVCGALVIGESDNIEFTPLPRTGNEVTYAE